MANGLTNGNGLSGLPGWVKATAQVGFPIVMVFVLVGLFYIYSTKIDAMDFVLRDHVKDTLWMQRQGCINTAILAGTSPALCDPPRDSR